MNTDLDTFALIQEINRLEDALAVGYYSSPLDRVRDLIDLYNLRQELEIKLHRFTEVVIYGVIKDVENNEYCVISSHFYIYGIVPEEDIYEEIVKIGSRFEFVRTYDQKKNDENKITVGYRTTIQSSIPVYSDWRSEIARIVEDCLLSLQPQLSHKSVSYYRKKSGVRTEKSENRRKYKKTKSEKMREEMRYREIQER